MPLRDRHLSFGVSDLSVHALNVQKAFSVGERFDTHLHHVLCNHQATVEDFALAENLLSNSLISSFENAIGYCDARLRRFSRISMFVEWKELEERFHWNVSGSTVASQGWCLFLA
jgi:hypothetical protein